MKNNMKNAKRSSKNNRSRRAKRSSPRQLQPLPRATTTPNSMRILQTYSYGNTITEGASGVGTAYYYRLNSVYDPDESGVGRVAGGYGTWSTLYYNYRVRRVTVRLQACATASADSFGTVFLIPLPQGSTLPSDQAIWRTIVGARMHPIAPCVSGGRNIVETTVTYDLAKLCRITRQQFNDMDYSGAVGSNPARQVYLALAFSTSGSSVAGSLKYAVQITYEVEWFNPIPMQL